MEVGHRCITSDVLAAQFIDISQKSREWESSQNVPAPSDAWLCQPHDKDLESVGLCRERQGGGELECGVRRGRECSEHSEI